MLIKGTDRKGNAIPMNAQESLAAAIGRACKALNTLERVYCPDLRTVKVEGQVKSLVGKDGLWEAWAEGTADIGFENTKTGNFHHPAPHTFKIHYKLAKDEWGLPDLEMVDTPEVTPIERNPSKLAGGPIPVAEVPTVLAEATERGIANAKAASKKARENPEQKQ